MRFESFADLLSMSGHGAFVWSAYGITLLVLVVNVVWPLLTIRQRLAGLRRADAPGVVEDP